MRLFSSPLEVPSCCQLLIRRLKLWAVCAVIEFANMCYYANFQEHASSYTYLTLIPVLGLLDRNNVGDVQAI